MAQHVNMYHGIDIKDVQVQLDAIIKNGGGSNTENKIIDFHMHHITDHYVTLIVIYDGTKVQVESSPPPPPPINKPPIISGATNVSIPYGGSWDNMQDIVANDHEDGDLISSVVVQGTVDTKRAGDYQLKYSVRDKEGLLATLDRTVTVEPFDNNKYYIMLIAGQSNAYGFDEGEWQTTDVNNDPNRLKYLGYHGDENLKVLPLEPHVNGFQNTKAICSQNKTSALPMANALLPMIPDDYKIIALPLVWGGGNFTGANQDGTYDPIKMQPTSTTTQYSLRSTSSFTTTVIERIKYILSWNKHNKFLVQFWCQGESDSAATVTNWSNAFLARQKRVHDELNSAGYGPRNVRGTFDNSSTFIWQSCPNYMDRDHMKAKFAWYRATFPTQVTNLPTIHSIVCSNESAYPIDHHHHQSSAPATHWGNDSYRKIIAPAMIKLMEDDGMFQGMKPVPPSSKEMIPSYAWGGIGAAKPGSVMNMTLGASWNVNQVFCNPADQCTVTWEITTPDTIEQVANSNAAHGIRCNAKARGPGQLKVTITGAINEEIVFDYNII
ncbi:MAG: immunoglobulin-like domain-containing protein [Paraclostridium sp.]